MIKDDNVSKPLVVALTGASGINYGIKLVESLVKYHLPPLLIVSKSAEIVSKIELNTELDNIKNKAKKVYNNHNIAADVASGSFIVKNSLGFVICPCSMKTLSLFSQGIEMNLIIRAGMCHLKEGHKIVVVPRETPISLPIIENMKQLALAGVVILPAMPAFYHHPQTIDDLENFIAGRILDQYRIPHELYERWGSQV